MPYSREENTLVTLAGLEEAEVLLVLDLVSDAMVVAAGTATHRSSGAKFNRLWGSSLKSSGGVREAAGHSRHLIAIHGSRTRSGGQGGHTIPYPLHTSYAPGKPHLRWLDSSPSSSLLK